MPRRRVPYVPRLSRPWRLAVGPLAVAAVVLVELALPRPRLAPFVLSYVAVVLASWIGGRIAGLLAVAGTAAAANWFFMPPQGGWSLGPDALWATALYLLAATLIAWLCSTFRLTAIAFQRQEEAARFARDRLALALQAGNSGWFDWDVRADRVEWSDELYELFGVRREDFKARYEDWLATIVPEDRAAADAEARRALRTGRFNAEFRIRRGDTGEVRWLTGRGAVLFGDDGAPVRFTGINTDVTARRVAEQARRESESRFRDLADNIPQLAWMAHPDGRVYWYNRRWHDYTGTTFDEMQARDPGDLLHPDHRARVVAKWHRAFAEGEVWEDTFPLLGKDGAYRWFLSRALPIRDDDGRILRWFGTNTDVTEQRAAELAARHNQRLLQATMENFPTVIAFKDREGRFVAVNRAVEHVLATPRERIVGRTMHDFVDAETADRMRAHELEVLEARRARQYEEPAPDGSMGPRYFLNTIFPLTDVAGGVYGTGHIAHDITAVRRVEGELRAANAQLREADRLKNDFLAVLSHELRNPLAPIRNAVFVLERAVPGGEQARSALGIVDRQVAHMARLIDDLLDVSRIGLGKVRLQREPLRLDEIVRGTGDDLRELFARGGIAFEVDLEAGDLWTLGDRTRLAQVVGNLLQNAAKFTPSGGRVRLALRRDGGQAVVEVRDDGLGMEPALIARLFEPFVQAEQTLERSHGGLGLGLALVKGLLDLHGGTIVAASEGPGRGSTFTVTLPLVPPPAGERRHEPRAPAGAARLSVLVVEDNADAAESLREVLRLGLGGHDVAIALDGPGGIAQARAVKPDLVLCDLGLPGLDGYGVARALRADPATAGAFLVALSGYALPEDVDRARAAGFDRHLAKPVEIAALARILADAAARVIAPAPH